MVTRSPVPRFKISMHKNDASARPTTALCIVLMLPLCADNINKICGFTQNTHSQKVA